MTESTEVQTPNRPGEEPDNAPRTPSEQEIKDLLQAVRVTLSRVHHDMSNPLSIISGNAQLLRALAEVSELRDDMVASLEDMEAAVQTLADSLDRLILLRNMIPRQE